jgi:hypothetical protein
MSELETLLQNVYQSEGAEADANKFYVAFFRTTLFMPANLQDDKDEPFSPLFTEEEGKFFVSVFDTLEGLKTWIEPEYSEIDYVEILGADVLRCIGTEQVYLCLNPGEKLYKEFAPDEIQRLKMMVVKLDSLKKKMSGKSANTA